MSLQACLGIVSKLAAPEGFWCPQAWKPLTGLSLLNLEGILPSPQRTQKLGQSQELGSGTFLSSFFKTCGKKTLSRAW